MTKSICRRLGYSTSLFLFSLLQKGEVEKRIFPTASLSPQVEFAVQEEKLWGKLRGKNRHCNNRVYQNNHPSLPRMLRLGVTAPCRAMLAGDIWLDRSSALSSHCLCREVLGKWDHSATQSQELSQSDTSFCMALAEGSLQEEITGIEGCREGTSRSITSLRRSTENKAN